jgi:hypothetical protein
MLVLFDQGAPVPLRPFLTGHTVETASQRGWDKLKNGELLEAAEEAGFEVLVTPDKNIRYQQNLGFRRIALVVLGNPPVAGALRTRRSCRHCGKCRATRQLHCC